MQASSPTFTLPRPPDPDWRPSVSDWMDMSRWEALTAAVRGVVEQLPGPERAVIVAEALSRLELDTLGWCADCRTSLPEGFCADHIIGSGLVDAFRRHAYTRLPGRPLIDLDVA
jgi:hypothetical protein